MIPFKKSCAFAEGALRICRGSPIAPPRPRSQNQTTFRKQYLVSGRTLSRVAMALGLAICLTIAGQFNPASAITGICDRTPVVREAILASIPGANDCANVSDAELAAITGKLDLREKEISSLTATDFHGLTAITDLDLSRNELLELPPGTFDGLSSLTKLKLARNNLVSLPPHIFRDLSALQDLDLWNNQLTTVPAGVFTGLDSLIDLCLEENELSALPPNAFAGLELRFLGLEGNSLSTLPAEVFSGLRVRTLDLSHNELYDLWPQLFHGTQVFELDLAANKLRWLPERVFSGLAGLGLFFVDQNPGSQFALTMVPVQISGSNSIEVQVEEAAPFDMTTSISVNGGSLPEGVATVTVRQGHVTSESIEITSDPGSQVTVELGTNPSFSGDQAEGYAGLISEVAGPLILSPPGQENLPPTFSAVEQFFRVAENSPAARDIGSPVTASDSPGDVLTYEVAGRTAKSFHLSPTSGQFRTKASLDFETKSQHVLRLSVTDSYGSWDEITVTINVDNVDEPPEIRGESAISFVEHNTNPVTRFFADDPEGAGIEWNLSGIDAGEFTIGGGWLHFREPPRFSNPFDSDGDNGYQVNILASDGDNSTELAVNVSVVKQISRGGGGGGSRRPPPKPAVIIPSIDYTMKVLDHLYKQAPRNLNLAHNIPNLEATFPDGSVGVADFLGHYLRTGNVTRWGYPTSEVLVLEDGTLTQFYQRGVVDFHDVGSGWIVERRLSWDFVGGGDANSEDQGFEGHISNPNQGEFLGPWGHKISNWAVDGTEIAFAKFFNDLGGVQSFGLPKSDARVDNGAPGMLLEPGTTLGFIRQYFQAAVLEYHPDDSAAPVQITLLGDTLRNLLVVEFADHPPFNAAIKLVNGDAYVPYPVPRVAEEG